MAGFSAVMKNRITEALNATKFTQGGFNVTHNDANGDIVTITRSEYRFVMSSIDNGFTTSECPGLDSDETQVFQRSDFESCIHAIQEWAERIVDREEADILDLFGGVADRNPGLPSK